MPVSKYLTFSKIERAQLLQLYHAHPQPVMAGDLIDKDAAHMLKRENFAFFDGDGYGLNKTGQQIAAILEPIPSIMGTEKFCPGLPQSNPKTTHFELAQGLE